MLKNLKNEIRLIQFSEYTKRTPLHIAAINGNIEIVQFLLKCNMNINSIDSNKMTPLNYACMNRHIEVARLLKENGGYINENSDMGTLFCSLAYKRDIETIRIFHECGANLILADYDNRTMAHIAAAEGQLEIMKLLVNETNFDIMKKDRWGNTPADDCTDEIKGLIKSKFNISNSLITLVKSKKPVKKVLRHIPHQVYNLRRASADKNEKN